MKVILTYYILIGFVFALCMVSYWLYASIVMKSQDLIPVQKMIIASSGLLISWPVIVVYSLVTSHNEKANAKPETCDYESTLKDYLHFKVIDLITYTNSITTIQECFTTEDMNYLSIDIDTDSVLIMYHNPIVDNELHVKIYKNNIDIIESITNNKIAQQCGVTSTVRKYYFNNDSLNKLREILRNYRNQDTPIFHMCHNLFEK